MADITEVIRTRRNTKEFTDKSISRLEIETLLELATWAPNHRNTEPWRFVVVQKGSDVRDQIGQGMIEFLEETSKTTLNETQRERIIDEVRDHPSLVYVFSLVGENDEVTEENYGAVCCAIQNIQLAATSMGLAVSWSTGRLGKIRGLKDILGVTYEAKCAGILTIGYSDLIIEKSRISLQELTDWL